MKIKDAIARASELLSQEPVGSPHMAAETLMMFALRCDRAHLFAHPERELTSEEQREFDEAVAQRATGKPLQYITGRQEFWGLDFIVSPAVLIPRPETEHLVEAALALVLDHGLEHPRIIDVGTGSGCIALALAHNLPQSEVHAVDLSPEALHIARENAKRLGLDSRVRFHQGDLLSGFPPHPQFDLVVSNPPYVGRCEQDKVQREVREHEPKMAVFAGEHGLDIYRRLIPQAHALLKPGGSLLMEIGFSIEQQVRDLLPGWEEVRCIPDLQGIPRVTVARKAAVSIEHLAFRS